MKDVIKMVIYYVRHGDPVYNPDGLTPLGERQAEAVARRLALYGVDEIYSSPSNRAMKTAKPLSEILKKPITELDWCNESLAWEEFTVENENGDRQWMFWDKKVREKFSQKSILDMRNDWYKDPFFDKKVAKGVERVNKAIDDFLSGFGYIHDRETGLYTIKEDSNKKIAIFAHQGFSMAFFSSLLDIPYPVFSTRFDISHSCFSVIHFPPSSTGKITPKILSYSNDSHIYKDGLPTRFNNGMHI